MIRWAKIVASGISALAVVASLSWAVPPNPDRSDNSRTHFAGKLPITELNEQEAILHALNRLGFGPHPGEVEQIQKTGLESWIQAQLHPENTADPVINARLAEYPALTLSAASLFEKYPPTDVAAKRLGMKVEEYQKHLQDLAKQPPGISSLPFKDQQEIVNELMQAKLIRAIYSEHQLTEQLEDFWFNHFNVFIYKDLDRWYMIPYERDAIRPHVLGKFRDLLEANAKKITDAS